jgi:hypothetical protein
LPHADLSAYESAAAYLRKMRPIMKSLEHETDWKKVLVEIRAKYGNRPRSSIDSKVAPFYRPPRPGDNKESVAKAFALAMG